MQKPDPITSTSIAFGCT